MRTPTKFESCVWEYGNPEGLTTPTIIYQHFRL